MAGIAQNGPQGFTTMVEELTNEATGLTRFGGELLFIVELPPEALETADPPS